MWGTKEDAQLELAPLRKKVHGNVIGPSGVIVACAREERTEACRPHPATYKPLVRKALQAFFVMVLNPPSGGRPPKSSFEATGLKPNMRAKSG